ncbi:MAG: 2Fe-2S iron-sulfur cluster binding domain-containing protein [Clostridia bacterium]|nr:2Fe-2S iron-sulfur cluster binding domain-containing protein [Clostridia bacterium]
MQITFIPGNSVKVTHEQTVLQAALDNGLHIQHTCNGNGTCGTCKVRILGDEGQPLTEKEQQILSEHEIKMGYRLACQVLCTDNMEIHPQH